MVSRLDTTQDTAMPDSNVILSMLFPQEESLGSKNKRLIGTYQNRILARIVLLESFFQASMRVQQVWEVLRKWYFGSDEYLYAPSDSQKSKDAKKARMRRDLKATKALRDEQIENVLFNLEKERPPADVDRDMKKYLDEVFSRLKTECSDYDIYPQRSLFPSELSNRSLPELVDFWLQQNYRPFYTENREIRKEIESSPEMNRVNDALRILRTNCYFAADISPDDRMIIVEFLMIRSHLSNRSILYLLTGDESLRLLGAWSRTSLGGLSGFEVVTTQGTKRCGHHCQQSGPCPIGEY